VPRISSPNPDFPGIPEGSYNTDPGYAHPAEKKANHPIPIAFQVTSPFSRTRVLMPHSLVLHVNPSSLEEAYVQKVERFQTRGGWVEQHWGQDLTEMSAEASTGAFMNIYTGLSSVLRQRTIAWDRYRDLHDLYLNNGSVYDPFGNIVLQGQVMILYDRGTYIGTFRTFEVEETDDSPFAFRLNWTFKVEHTLMGLPQADGLTRRAPAFQGQNIPVMREETTTPPDVSSSNIKNQQASQQAADQRRTQAAPIQQAAATGAAIGSAAKGLFGSLGRGLGF
jgi:hypothetical protein